MSDLGVPTAGTRATPPSDEWTPSPGAPGWFTRTLLQTPGYSTELMRVEPGTTTTPHAHGVIEQVYVLEGSFYDDEGGEYPSGTFIIRAAGAMHSGGSRDGATLLVVYGDVA